MTNKEDLEKILNQLHSKEAVMTFFEKAIANQELFKPEMVPEKYIDDVLEMQPTDAMVSVNRGEFKEDPRKRQQLYFMAELAENSERYETAAHIYKQLDNIQKAIECARNAGLDELAQEWAEDYIQAAYNEEPGRHSNSPAPQVECAANRAKQLGLGIQGQQIVLDYLNSHIKKQFDEQSDMSDPEFCESLARMANSFDLPVPAEKCYTRAMHLYEERGDYDCALRVARTLDNTEKIQFYDNLRYLVADHRRREQIEQDRADDADGREFERPK